MSRPDLVARARRLRALGADYATHVVGDWFEVGSRSDGMCGRVWFENDVTTERVGYHWSVTHPTCQSQHAAREAARKDFLAEAAGVPNEAA